VLHIRYRIRTGRMDRIEILVRILYIVENSFHRMGWEEKSIHRIDRIRAGRMDRIF
jgi:hypothetical protein